MGQRRERDRTSRGAAPEQLEQRCPAPPELDALPANFLDRVTDVLDESASNGAVLSEVRFGRDTVLRPDFMELFRAAEERVRRVHPGFHAEPLATIVADADLELAKKRVRRCLELAKEGLAGVDFIPQPYDSEADWRAVYRWAGLLADAGLGITVHAGEFSPANLLAALRLPGIRRLGHAVAAGRDPRLLEAVFMAGVTVECCLTSNLILGAVSSVDEHPIAALVGSGVPVTLNTDNPVRFRTTIAQEYGLAARMGFTSGQLLGFTRNAVQASFTTEARKAALLAHIGVSVPPAPRGPS